MNFDILIGDDMSETKLQAKIQKMLRASGWYVVRVIAASKGGVADLICCDTNGKFVAIELKYGKNKPSDLQAWNKEQVEKRGGIAYIVYTTEELRRIIKVHSVQEVA